MIQLKSKVFSLEVHLNVHVVVRVSKLGVIGRCKIGAEAQEIFVSKLPFVDEKVFQGLARRKDFLVNFQ